MMMRLNALLVLQTARTGMSKQRPHSSMLKCHLIGADIHCKVLCALAHLSKTSISKRAGYAMLLVRRCANVLSLDAGSRRGYEP